MISRRANLDLMKNGRGNFCMQELTFLRKIQAFLSTLLAIIFSLGGGNQSLGQTNASSFVPVAAEALSNSSIRCFYKDSKGYMWIGTEDALIRYDGNKAYRYVHDPNDKTSVAHNTVNIITEGKDRKLWIGTAQGLCIYDRELDHFINVDSIKANRNYLNNRYITDLEFDNHGRLWIGTHEGGINIYDPAKKEFSYIADPPQGGVLPSSNFINQLVSIGDTIWCASKGGLLLYDTQTKGRLALKSLSRFSDAQISSIVQDKSGGLLIATVLGKVTKLVPDNGGYSFQELLSGSELGESANRILTMCLDNRNNILIGGENSGFNLLEGKNRKLHRFPADEGNAKRLPTNAVQSIYADDLGLIWIGTLNNGVFMLDNNRKKFETSELSMETPPFENKDVRSFAEDREGNIWVASYGVGLGRINAATNDLQRVEEINDKISNKNITSLLCDRNGDLWVGTAGKGVYRLNPKTYRLENYSVVSEGFGNDQVFCLYEDKKGILWAGTWGSGLFFFDPTTNKFAGCTEYDQANHIPNTAYISDMLEDSEGTFWVGTLYGLYELNRRTNTSFNYRVHLPEERNGSITGTQIQAIVEDRNSDLWIGTPESLNLKTKGDSEFTAYAMSSGTLVNTVRSLLVDRHGNVWIAGNNGLSKFNPGSKTFTNYTRDDGLKSNNFHRKAALASSTGKFFFGGINGFDSFFPDGVSTTSSRATVVFSDLKISNQSVKPGVPGSPLNKHIALTSAIDLSYDQRSFVIDFIALDYRRSSSYSYCYKLEGFDEEWNCAGNSHSATYTNIDPGDYVFLVKTANRDGVWTETPLKLDITIQQVFWKTWWAYCLYTAVLIALIFLIIRIRIERLKLKNEIRFEKLTREHEHTLMESKTNFFTNVAHEFRTPLSLILIPLESLMGTSEVPSLLRERIYTAYKNASRMRRLVNELLDFNKLESGNLKLNVQHGELIQFIKETSSAFNEMALQRGIVFSVTSDTPAITGWFDRDKLERIIFNVLSNAFKFTSEAGEIKLKISGTHSIISNGALTRCIQLVIEDNGIGISQEELPRIFEKFYQAKSSSKISGAGTGIGLSLTKALVELHQGSITAESIPNEATIFSILLPVDGHAYQIDETLDIPPGVVQTTLTEFDFVSPATSEPADNDDATEKHRILVVEDNVELRQYLVSELRREFSVVEARDGEEGLAIALEKNPDLIISDIMMPLKDGIELCDAIKSDLNTSHIPFILLTARATIEEQINGIKTGADLYVSKPFNIRYLIAHVHQIINSRQKLYARFSQDVYLMPGKATTNALDQEFLQKALDYIVANLQDPQLSVDSVAALFNLSRMQAYRKIKALTGKSVVEFIKMVRMKQAIKLMDSHRLTLSEIAFEVGFNSASYFTRCFKEEYGKTPSEYLEQT